MYTRNIFVLSLLDFLECRLPVQIEISLLLVRPLLDQLLGRSLGLRESQAVLQSPPAFLTLHLKAVSREAFTPFQFQYALKCEHHWGAARSIGSQSIS